MPKTSPSPAHTWAFASRFRRGAYGWKGSRPAIERLDNALAEIRAVARHDPALAGEGAVRLLEKLSPALSDIDSSSGALGNATYAAVQQLVPLIAQAPVEVKERDQWLERLFEAIQNDDPPYIESLGDHWGELCASVATASAWADQLLPLLRSVLRERQRGTFAYFTGTSLCYSALFKAGRHDEILALLDADRHPIWPYLVWGGRVLAARGQIDEAIAYVSHRAGSTTSAATLACFAETLLLQAGRRAEAFDRYALMANQANTHLSTYRALAKKYPEIPPQQLLTHLVHSTPVSPGKWFATAKTLKLYDEATRLAWASPCDPHTLLRASRDHQAKQPAFAMECALAALHWMAQGHGYELTTLDVRQAHQLATEAATACQQPERAQAFIDELLTGEYSSAQWLRNALGMAPVRNQV